MGVKYKFIASIHHLQLDKITSRGIRLFDDLRISLDSSMRGIVDDYFIHNVGMLEYEQLKNGPYYYAISRKETSKDLFNPENAFAFLDYYLIQIQLINNLLWLIKSHSINTETAFLQVEKEGKIKHYSNNRVTAFSNHNGKKEDVTFSSEDFKKALKLKDFLYDEFNSDTVSDADIMHEQIYKAKRLERTFYILQSARSFDHLPLRISNFVTILETLLSTSSSEVTHKLRERVAWLLGEDFEGRTKIYKIIGDIYSVRSNYVHGNSMPKKFNTNVKLVGLSVEIEDLVRKLILKILLDEDINEIYKRNNDEEIENWLLDVCLGKIY